MSGGASIIFALAAVFTGATILKLIADAQDARDEVFGDLPELPEEMRRAAIASPGEGGGKAARAQTHTADIAHRDGSVTR